MVPKVISQRLLKHDETTKLHNSVVNCCCLKLQYNCLHEVFQFPPTFSFAPRTLRSQKRNLHERKVPKMCFNLFSLASVKVKLVSNCSSVLITSHSSTFELFPQINHQKVPIRISFFITLAFYFPPLSTRFGKHFPT